MAEHYPVGQNPPTYRSWKPARIPKARVYALLDSLFAGVGLLLAAWYAALLLLGGLTWSWQSIAFFIGSWLALTYLVLPRVHQMFTTLYVPDYFLARTKTGDGLLGDPVNLAMCGDVTDIHAIMRRAGWTQADEITLRSALGIVTSSLTGRSYPAAPVSNLFLFGSRHAFAYQQEVDGSAAQRHHVRFWKVPDDCLLPGGIRVDWLAAGTYDRSVGLSTKTLQVTHKIDPNIDAERDYIIDTIRYQDPVCSVDVLRHFSTAFHDENGGGDAVFTDGHLPIIDVSGAYLRAQNADAVLEQPDTLRLPTRRTFTKELPPPPFWFAGAVLLLNIVALLISAAHNVLRPAPEQGASWLTLGPSIAVTLVLAGLLVLTIKRYKWARLALLVMSCLSTALTMYEVTIGPGAPLGVYLNVGLGVALVLAFSAPSVREYVYAGRHRGGPREAFAPQ